MSARNRRLGMALGTAALCAALLGWSVLGRGHAAAGQNPDLAKAKYYGVTTCNKCHTEPGRYSTDFVKMTEYATWATRDKHALAYAALEGDRGRQIGRLLGLDVTKDAKCLNCHATTSRPERQGKDFSLRDGVSCDGCHGPAEHWILDHAFKTEEWRAKTARQKEALGMFDVRDPAKRAAMCMSCHVGNAAEGKVITHAMYAAGHPPLPGFEVAGFSKNLPRHWYDLKDVPFLQKANADVRKIYHLGDAAYQHTKLARATSLVGLRTALELTANRATLAAKAPDATGIPWPPPWLRPYATNAPKDRWPEFRKVPDTGLAEELRQRWPEIAMPQLDCYACHHELKSKSWRQVRGYAGRPGRPTLPAWPTALAPLSVPDSAAAGWEAGLKKLRRACDARPFGDPADLARAAEELDAYAARQFARPDARVDRPAALRMLKGLCAVPEDEFPDYDSARQLAWAVRVIYSEWQAGHDPDKRIEAILQELDDELNLTLQSKVRKPFVEERYALTKGLAADGAFEKAVKDKKGFLDPLQKISDRELAAALDALGRYDPVKFKKRLRELAGLLPAPRSRKE